MLPCGHFTLSMHVHACHLLILTGLYEHLMVACVQVEGKPSDAESFSDESDQEVWAEIRRERREKRIEELQQSRSLPALKAPPTVTMTTGANPASSSRKVTK